MSESNTARKIPVESSHSAKSASELVIAGTPVGNIREKTEFANTAERSTTYNTSGVRPEDPYNYFHEGKAESVENNEGEPSNQEADPTWTGTVLKAVEAAVSDIDDLGETDKRHDTEMGELKETLAEKDLKIQELEERLKALEDRLKLDVIEGAGEPGEESSVDKDDDVLEAEEEPTEKEKVPGKELELYKGVDNFTPEVAPELQLMLDQVTDKYAELTAKHRKGYLGHFLKNSKYIVKLPGMKFLAEKINDYTDADIIEARTQYEGVINQIQGSIHSQYEAMMEASPERDLAIQVAAGMFAIEHAGTFEAKVVTERLSGDEKTNKFVNWWVNQEGIKGKIKKALIVGGTGIAVGLATGGLGAPAALGILLGGASGAAIANHVTKRRAKSVDAEGVTLAERQSAEDVARVEAYGEQQRENEDFITSRGLTDVVEDRTTTEKVGNRARIKSAAAIGGAAGGLGATLGDNFNNSPTVERGFAESSIDKPLPEVEVTPESTWSVPESFPIESGDGMTQGIQNALESVGYDLTPDQYWNLHKSLTNQFGTDYIINRGIPTDSMFVDSNSSFAPGVAEAIKSWGVANAGWSI